jgi:hypothetical protein
MRAAHKQLRSVFLPLSHEILDSELFELMHQNGDYTHFYFCYRWFLLDFKRGKKWVYLGIRAQSRNSRPVSASKTLSFKELKKKKVGLGTGVRGTGEPQINCCMYVLAHVCAHTLERPFHTTVLLVMSQAMVFGALSKLQLP